MASKTKIHIFYSWQSDSSKKTNLNAIRKALQLACKRLENVNPKLKLVPDEATRDTSGSPNIALKILEKIEEAAIFIADVTTVTPVGAARPCPNPNVGYELGYAVATLGWDRVILLFNDAIGQFPADLPFDFIQNRASPYTYAEADPTSKREELATFLEVAIKAVLNKNPKRPAELKGLSREKIEHDHDVENMRWLMETLHLPTLQQHVTEMPHAVSDRAIWFYEGFQGVVTNALFSLYDPVLQAAVDKLYLGWRTALSHDNEYHETPSGKMHVFTNPGDMPLAGDRQAVWDEIAAACKDIADGQSVILDRLRAGYLEINIHKTNAKAWKGYIDFEREVGAQWDANTKRRKKKKGK
ncbi:MAG: nucleotide-binding protein [Alphaproteobacteria bacterium]|nr:nucleotide-binding protein [Alphaproteobacteria bacterium]